MILPALICPDTREIGDINFDCVLNVQDVTFSRIYITEAPLSFTGSLAYLLQNVTDAQRAALDSDRNGVINIDDAFYLLRVIFRLLRFIGDGMAVSRPPECGLQVSFTLYNSGNTLTDGSDADKTFLGLLLAGDDKGFQQVFDNDSLVASHRLPLNTDTGLFGGIVNTTYIGNGTFTVSFGRELVQYSNIGISLVQLTVDDLDNSNLARQEFLRGIPQAPYMYASLFRVDAEIRGSSITLLASNGYNPLFVVNSSLSELCDSSVTVASTLTSIIASSTLLATSVSPTIIPTSTSTLLATSVSFTIMPTSTSTLLATSISFNIMPTSTSVLLASSVSPTIIPTSTSTLLATSVSFTVMPTSANTVLAMSISFNIIPTSTSTLLATSVSSTTMPTSTTTLLATSDSPTIIPTSTTTLLAASVSSTIMPTSASTVLATSISFNIMPTSTSILLATSVSPTIIPTSTSTLLSTSTIIPTPTIVPELPPITPMIVAGADIKLIGQTLGNSSTNYNQEFGLLAASSENVEISLGGYTSQVLIQKARQPATRFRASVLHHSNRVWSDGRTVPVVFQIHDEDWSSRVQVNTQINMHVTLISSSENMVYNCTPNNNTGMCTIIVIFPQEWFNDISVQHANLTYMTPEPTLITTLQLQPFATVSSIINQVVVELPSRTIFPGETFSADLYAYNSFSITGFNLVFETGSNLNIISSQIVSSLWSYDVSTNNQQYAVAAISTNPDGNPNSMGRVLLLTLNLHAARQITDPNSSFINGTVVSLSDTRGLVVLSDLDSTSGPMILWTRNMSSTITMVDIVEDHPITLFAVATTNEIVNTAVLNGVDKTADISVIAGLASGQLQVVTNGLTCSSSDMSVLSINDQCSTVNAGNSEAPYVNFTINYVSVSVDVTFKIWFPQMPLQVVLSDDILNTVEIGSCNIYQKATITVLANFTNGGSAVQDVVVTDFVSSNILSMQPDIANITDAVVYGVSMGETDICVHTNELILGCANVSVSVEPVTVYNLTTIVVNDIVVATNPLSDSISINVRYRLEIEGDQAAVITAVQYTDGTIFLLEDTETLLQSTNLSVVDTERTNIIARSSGTTRLNITWLPVGCVTGVHSLAEIILSLEDPIRLIVTPSSQMLEITPPLDAAGFVGIPTTHKITAQLVYRNNRTQDVTNHSKTVYTIGNGLLLTNMSSGKTVTVSNSSSALSANITVSYPSLYPQFIFFEIVRAQQLELLAHPYPLYDGSFNDIITQLKLISNTGIRQQAALRLTLTLSSNRNYIVTTHDMASIRPIASSPSDLLNVTSVVQISSDVVLSVLSQAEGSLMLEGSFMSSSSISNLTITFSSSQVSLSSFTINPLPSGTLRGEYGWSTMHFTIDAFFDDGTVISNLVPSNLPGLVNFISLNSGVFAVTEHGILTPLANTHTEVAVETIAIVENIQHRYNFFVNLDPSLGDVDLGNVEGAPIMLSSQSVLQVPVYANTGQSYLGAIQLDVRFNPQVLQAVNVTEGSDWVQGIYEYNMDNTGGSVEFGGAINAERVRGSRVHIFTLNFEVVVISPVITNLLTNVLVITYFGIESSTIGDDTPRLSRAGNVTFMVSPVSSKRSVMRRSRVQMINKFTSKHLTKRQTPQCTGSTCVMVGDTNGDSTFDIRDVSYTLMYIVEATLGFSSTRGMQIILSTSPAQSSALDADLNSVIDIADAIFLLKSVFRLVYIVQEPTITPVNQSRSCLLEISVTLTTGTEAPVDDVEVFFDIGLPNIEAHQNFTSSKLLIGTVITYNKGNNLFGGIVRAQRSSLTANQYIVQINSSIVNSIVGISVLQVTFDALNISRPSRTAQSFGVMTLPLVYPHELDFIFSVRGYNFTVFAPNGYNPLVSSELYLVTVDCSINTVGNVNVSVNFEDSLSTTEYAIITVSLGIFILGVLVLLITICSCCQSLREKTFGYQKMMTNDFTQEDYYVVSIQFYIVAHKICDVSFLGNSSRD